MIGPIKKSKEQIDFYIEYGAKVGLVIRDVIQILQSVRKFNTLDANDLFVDYSRYRIDWRVEFPFSDQIGPIGTKFPQSICVSVNDTVAHGFNNIAVDLDKDVVSLDFGIKWKGMNFDSAVTIGGNEEWIYAPLTALKCIRDENPKNTQEVAYIINREARNAELGQVLTVLGHGIGHALHEYPMIHGAPGRFHAAPLFNGLCFCPEPAYVKTDKFCLEDTYTDSDGWALKTVSELPASHFETTFCVIDNKLVDVIGITNLQHHDGGKLE